MMYVVKTSFEINSSWITQNNMPVIKALKNSQKNQKGDIY